MRFARLALALSVLAASTALIAVASLPRTSGPTAFVKAHHDKSGDVVGRSAPAKR